MNRLFILLFALFIFNNEIFAQTAKVEFVEAEVTSELDTLLITRKPGNLFFGVSGGLENTAYFGKFLFPEIIIPDFDQFVDKIDYDLSSYFPSINVGTFIEYNPVASNFEYALYLTGDLLSSKFNKELKDSLNTSFSNKIDANYFSLSPRIQYTISRLKGTFFEGLFTFGGLSISIPLSVKSSQTRTFYNPESIQETQKYDFANKLTRFCAELGIGWEFFANNITGYGRTILSPYFSISAGSKMIDDYGSNLNAISFKLGVSLKFGKDNIETQKIDRIPTIEDQIKELAIKSPEYFNLAMLDYKVFDADKMEPIFIEPEIVEFAEIEKLPEIKVETPVANNTETKKTPQKPRVEFDRQFIVNYTSSEKDVELSKSGMDFFDEIAQFMKQNPGCIIIIEGFNDDRGGSIRENQRISIERAENAKKELVKRGIQSGRIVSSGKGAIKNIASNATAAGRAKNRRIEIIIKQNKPKK